MGSNVRSRTLSDYVKLKANLLAQCGCGHVGVLDAVKLRRYFFCFRWNEYIETVGYHLYCSKCRGRPVMIKPAMYPPDRPKWMQHEHEWKALVKRLR